MSELGELRASVSRAQRELEAANERLDALESREPSTATVLTPLGQDRQKRKLIIVGALSSAGTAILLGLSALVFSSSPPPRPPIAAAPMPPPALTIPPPPETVAVPEPPPPPIVATPEPPRPPVRIARVNPRDPVSVPPSRERERADSEPEGTGSLTIVCRPMQCDSIIDNGVPLGGGHIFNRPVPAGPHRITLHTPNGQTKSMRVDVHAGQLKEIRVSMIDSSEVF